MFITRDLSHYNLNAGLKKFILSTVLRPPTTYNRIYRIDKRYFINQRRDRTYPLDRN